MNSNGYNRNNRNNKNIRNNINQRQDNRYYSDISEMPARSEYRQRRQLRKRRSSAKRVMAVIIFLALAAVAAFAAYIAFYKPDTGGSDTFVEYVTDEFGNKIEVSHEYEQSDGKYNILLLGQDREAMLTDVFMIININENDGKMSILQIPRDTYVTSTDGVPVRSNKINELFSDHYGYRVRNGEKADEAYKGALKDVKELIEKSLCIRINFSAIMDLDGFRGIVDAIGGVEINIPQPLTYSDPDQNLYINIPAGNQTLDGEMAEKFVRFRDNYSQGDLGRVNAQKTFMVAFFSKVKSSMSLTNTGLMSSVSKEILSNLITDMNLADAVYFGKGFLSMDLSSITMQTLPGQLEEVSYSYYIMNKAAAVAAVNGKFNVYDKPVSEGVFDSAGMFNNASSTYISGLYYAPAENVYDAEVYTGDSVNENGIKIPLKKKWE